jgi:hypothetical protein
LKFFRSIFEFYINASIHVALAVASLVAVTAIEFDLSLTNSFYYFIIFGSITGYNFVKYAEIAGLHHRSLVKRLKGIQVFSLFCFFGMLIFALRLSLNTLLVTLGFAVITLLYAVPLLFKKNLRSIAGLKITMVALVWTGVTVLLPFVSIEDSLSGVFYFTFIQRFIVVIVLILPFDIRDLQYDKTTLKTIPQSFGIKKTKRLGIFLLTIVLIMEGFKAPPSAVKISVLVFVCFLVATSLVCAQKKQSKYFTSFWVESIPIVWYLLLFAF